MREKCHVPPKIRFRKKWEIADQMLQELGPRFPHSRILADAEFGMCGEFRDCLGSRQESYLLDIPLDLEIRVYQGDFLIPAPTTPEKWAKKAMERTWNRFDLRDTARGVLLIEGIMTRVVTIRKDKTLREEILIVKRDVATGELKYALANGDSKVSLRRLLQDWSRRHTVEECFQRAKSDLGMDHYEVRSWVGWHHHITLVMLALCFLEKEKIKKHRSFSPSDGFSAGLDHERVDPTSGKGLEDPGKESHRSAEKVFRRQVPACPMPKRVKIINKDPSETMVN